MNMTSNLKKIIISIIAILGIVWFINKIETEKELKNLFYQIQPIEQATGWEDTPLGFYESKIVDYNSFYLPDINKVAREYIKKYVFSKKALIHQLIYDGYSLDEAEEAVDKINNLEFVSAAKLLSNEYKRRNYSRDRTINRLIEDGFDTPTIIEVIRNY